MVSRIILGYPRGWRSWNSFYCLASRLYERCYRREFASKFPALPAPAVASVVLVQCSDENMLTRLEADGESPLNRPMLAAVRRAACRRRFK